MSEDAPARARFLSVYSGKPVEGLRSSAWRKMRSFFYVSGTASGGFHSGVKAKEGHADMKRLASGILVAVLSFGEIAMGDTSALTAAKRAKKDEFYTQRVDIENELRHYKSHFEGKVVLCNCDDPRQSEFFKYFAENFEKLKLKRLIAVCYKSQDVDLFSQGDCERAIKQVYEGDKNGNMIVDDDEVGVFNLKGDGDFRSNECIEILKEADIVVTNPPFSLFREYLAQLMKFDKKFLIIGNVTAVTHSELFSYIRDNRIWLGASIHSGDRKFGVPEGYPLNAAGCGIDENGKRFIRVKGVRWFTNLDYPQRHEILPLYKRYTPNEFPKYDNYDAINVDKTSDIPYDYDGIMGVPITFIDKYNPEQFELIGIGRGDLGREIGVKKNARGRTDLQLTIEGKVTWPFQRILIRRRKP